MLKESKIERTVAIKANKGEIGKALGKNTGKVIKYLTELSSEEKEAIKKQLEDAKEVTVIPNKQVEIEYEEGQKVKINKNLVTVEIEEKNVMEEKYLPSVIEPSFGIGRIVYVILEHCFKVRAGDEKRTYFEFPPLIAPYKASILPLVCNEALLNQVHKLSTSLFIIIETLLNYEGISSKIDDSSQTIGRRYDRKFKF